MLRSFTRNYSDQSSEAGFEFTFMCDCCGDGYKSSFVQSETYKKKGLFRGLGKGASIVGGLVGGRASSVGNAANSAGGLASDRFSNMSPEWHKEHERAFDNASNEAKRHFKRCPSCNKYACDACHNEDEGLCVSCAPRQEVYVAKARADAMQRNIDEKAATATVWQGNIESKMTSCPNCGKPAGTGKFCNNCGASMDLSVCAKCGAKNSQNVKFCNNCGTPMGAAPSPPTGKCSACGEQNDPGMKFCGGCGSKLA